MAKNTAKNTKSFEESLWDTATKLRGSVESSENGVAGSVLASSGELSRTTGSMSINTTGEGAIRQKMVENDLVDFHCDTFTHLAA